MTVRRKQIRDLVETLLSEHRIFKGPVPIERIARSLGIEITLDEVDDNLSGFLFRDKKDNRAIIGANKSHSLNRRRFTIAHELGHFLLHEGELVHLDEAPGPFLVNLRDDKSASGEDANEREANLFAAELLMPAKFLRQDLEGERVDLLDGGDLMERLARKYKVSVQALTFRLTNLAYIRL